MRKPFIESLITQLGRKQPLGLMPQFITTKPSLLSSTVSCIVFISFFRQLQLNLGFSLIHPMEGEGVFYFIYWLLQVMVLRNLLDVLAFIFSPKDTFTFLFEKS